MPGSYSVGQGFGAGLDSWHGRIAVLNYVSLGSLTGVGSGEVVAVLPPATVLTTLEAVFGQFYIAVVVAQLVRRAALAGAAPKRLARNLSGSAAPIPFTDRRPRAVLSFLDGEAQGLPGLCFRATGTIGACRGMKELRG